MLQRRRTMMRMGTMGAIGGLMLLPIFSGKVRKRISRTGRHDTRYVRHEAIKIQALTGPDLYLIHFCCSLTNSLFNAPIMISS